MEHANPIAYATPAAADLRPTFRPLPPLVNVETRGARLAAGAVAALFAVFYFAFLLQYWAPAHSGVDQNGYLVGGKYLAWTGTTGFKPAEPLGFVSSMWVRNDETGMNYPKYPVGLPLLYAVALWTCGKLGPAAAFLVSPVSAAAAALGTYFLSRRFAGTFASFMAMVAFAFSQVMLVLADNPNSHASCLAFCVWGTFLLIGFWETASVWRGLLGGFLIGYAATIRYTEGLMGLMIGAVVLSAIFWTRPRGWVRALAPVLGWAIPVGYLVGFNLVAMRTPTGYDSTNESVPGAAFTIEHVGENWEKLVRQLHDTGLFFILPLGILGMFLAVRTVPRRAALLWLWLLPGTATYMAYYWAPERGVSYLRFFLTLMPPIIVGVAVLIDRVVTSSVTRWQRAITPIACGLVVAGACAMSTYRGLLGIEDGQETGQGMEALYRQNVNLAALADVVTRTVPAGSTLFAPPAPLNDFQFVGDYECFSTEYFQATFATRLRGQKERLAADDPDPIQPARRDYLLKQLEPFKTDEQLGQEQLNIVRRALDAKRRVFLVCRRDQTAVFTRRYERGGTGLTWTVRASYHDLPRLRPPEDPPPADAPPVRGGGGFGRPNRGPGGGPNGIVGGRPAAAGAFAGGRRNVFRFNTEAPTQQWQVIEITRRQK